MPRAVRFGNTNGRVDKTSIGEAAKRSRKLSEGEEVWVDPPLLSSRNRSRSKKPKRRSSREVDPQMVDLARLSAVKHLLDVGRFTPGEIAAVLNISRATVYRYRELISLRREAYRPTEYEEYDEYDD